MSPKGFKHSDMSRSKMSLSHKGKPNNQLGRHHSEKSKLLMSIAKVGNKNGLGNRGKPLTEEHKRNIGLSHLGKRCKEDTKRKIRLANVGQKRSEKSKLKMSISQTGKKRPFTDEHRKNHKIGINKIESKEKQKIAAKERNNRPEVKEKIATTLAKHIADGSVKSNIFMDTKPELIVFNNYINRGYKEGIDIIKQCYIKGIQGLVDFYLPKENTIIFVDGDWWHCNSNHPIFGKPDYFHPLKKMFAKQIQDRDKNITDKCLALGYKVNRIWESNITKKDLVMSNN